MVNLKIFLILAMPNQYCLDVTVNIKSRFLNIVGPNLHDSCIQYYCTVTRYSVGVVDHS